MAKVSKDDKPKGGEFEVVFRLTPQQQRERQAKQAELEEARRTIDRAVAIRDGQLPPPWITKRKTKDGIQVTRVKQAIKVVFADGQVPEKFTLKQIQNRIAPEFKHHSWKLASLDTIARAIGRRR